MLHKRAMAFINIADSRVISRIDSGFCIVIILALIAGLTSDSCLCDVPGMWAVAHIRMT